jgi:DUF1009 family protein
VVVSRGVAVAVEAIEGTNETIQRGCRLSGPGAVVVKAIAARQDYRFDLPAVGPDTLEVMARGGARALAVEGRRPRSRIRRRTGHQLGNLHRER